MGKNKDQDKQRFWNRTITIDVTKISSFLRMNLTSLMNKKIEIQANSLVYPFLYFTCLFIYLELILHLINYKSLDGKIIYPILFSLFYGAFFTLITGFFIKTVNLTAAWAVTGVTCLLFCVQLLYFYVFKVYFSFQSIGMAGDAISEFGSDILMAMKDNSIGLLLIFIPLPVLAYLQKHYLDFRRRSMKRQGRLCIAVAAFKLIVMLSLLIFGKEDYSPYDLYHHSRVLDLCGRELGITAMMRIDVVSLSAGKEKLELQDTISNPIMKTEKKQVKVTSPVSEKAANTSEKTDQKSTSNIVSKTDHSNLVSAAAPLQKKEKISYAKISYDTSPNVMNIDFKALAAAEKNQTIRTLDQYFAAVTPTNKNKYTGMFKGYNLILLTAEGFSPLAVNKEKTPTLYRLTREGFVFNNFYTPLWQTSTSDGEYVAMTGLIPTGTRSMYRSRKNYLPFTLGNQFDRLGIASKAYHDHTYTYYQRNETHPNLGYDFKGIGNGLKLAHNVWPNSDLEMMNATIPNYIKEPQFHVYYMTVSGHMNYTFMGNSMSSKNRQLVEDLPCSTDGKAYIACQIELDKALKQLISKLEEAGIADRTVIALSADHYPYGWAKSKLDNLAGHVIDPDFEIYRNHFILWCEGMKEKIIVDKPCSSLDILPTLSNLFGLEYDSRLLMGQDILSDAEPLVILSNRSFVTDQVKYNSKTGEVIKLTKEKLPADYISTRNRIIKNKFLVSQSILATDYYRKVVR